MLQTRKQFFALLIGVGVALSLLSCSPLNIGSNTVSTSTPTPMAWMSEGMSELVEARRKLWDGKLELFIEAETNACLPWAQPNSNAIPIRLFFKNTSSSTLVVLKRLVESPSDFPYPGRNLITKFAAQDGTLIQGPALDLDTRVWRAQPDDFVQIPPFESYETVIYVHSYGSGIIPHQDGLIDVYSGDYWLTLHYRNSEIGPETSLGSYEILDWNAWVGEITSNAIKICIQL